MESTKTWVLPAPTKTLECPSTAAGSCKIAYGHCLSLPGHIGD